MDIVMDWHKTILIKGNVEMHVISTMALMEQSNTNKLRHMYSTNKSNAVKLVLQIYMTKNNKKSCVR